MPDPDPNLEEPQFRFGVLADVQYADQPDIGQRYFRRAIEKLRDCVADLNRRDLAFVVQLGDLIDRDFENFNTVLGELRQLRAPLYHVLGNHDYYVLDELKPLLCPTLGLESSYYESVIGRWRLIFLDGNELCVNATAADSRARTSAQQMIYRLAKEQAPNAHEWNGAISGRQIAWLTQRLERASIKGEDVLLFCHYPLQPLNEGTLLNWQEVLGVIRQYPCVRAWLSGHYHDGNYERCDHLHLLNFKGMLETCDQTAYAIVSVFPDRLQIDGIGREPRRTLHLEEPVTPRALNPRND
jgi:3',5'-cyclic AMP phosphodiesterase CpdA